MITTNEATFLLKLPKIIQGNNKVDLTKGSQRFIIIPYEKDYVNEHKFLLDINISEKKAFRISLHHQEDISKIGLMRVDFGARHPNPETITENLPIQFHKYAGVFLDEPHIHFYVEGYKPLSWALPLADYFPFKVKEVNNNSDLKKAIINFGHEIGLNSVFTFEESLFL